MNAAGSSSSGSNAAAEARRELQGSGQSIDAVLRAGAVALQSGTPAEVIPMTEAALRTDPGHAQLWQLNGLLHRAVDESEAALQAFDKAAELAPEDPLIAQSRAVVALEAGLPAIDLFESALQLKPGDEGSLLGLAAARLAAGEAEAAVALIESRLARHPGWLAGHRSVARIRWSRGERDRFTASLERALQTASRDVRIWQAYIELLLQAELYERVIAAAAQARAAAGAHLSFDAAEATARAERGETRAADALFSRLMPLSDIPLLVHYVRHLIRTGRVELALQLAWREAPRDSQHLLWPYLSAGWRLTGDPRWEWLEGDDRFIGVYDLSERLGPIEDLARALRPLHLLSHQPLHQSVRNGTQTEGHLFRRLEPEIRALRKAVLEAVEEFATQLPPRQEGHPLLGPPRSPVRFAGAWSVRLTGGGHHAMHVHPAGWLSSAFYVAVPEPSEMGDRQSGWLVLGEPQAELGLDLAPIRMVEPKPGRLVLFPSTMWHGTRPFAAGERLTVAFDVARPTR